MLIKKQILKNKWIFSSKEVPVCNLFKILFAKFRAYGTGTFYNIVAGAGAGKKTPAASGLPEPPFLAGAGAGFFGLAPAPAPTPTLL